MGGAGRPYLSRHFLAEQARCLTPLPFPPGGAADAAGVSVQHNLLALGAWAEDAQEHRLSVVDLAVGYAAADVARAPALVTLASFAHRGGGVRAVAAADLAGGGGEVLLVAAGADGSLARLRLGVPTMPGAQPAAVSLAAGDFDGGELAPWLPAAHAGAATAVDVSAEAGLVASAGADGSVAVNAPDAGEAAAPLYDARGGASFTAARWATPATLLATTLQGALLLFDARRAGPPALRLCAGGGEPLLALAAQGASHAAATGGAGGAVALWDLRAGEGAGPARRVKAGGAVAALAYGSGGGGGGARLAYATQRGAVGVVAEGGAARLLYSEPHAALTALALSDAGAATQIVAATDQEGLLFMANA
jgi:hypothetical protein